MLIAIVVLALLILLNGVFAMSELAMMTARRSRLQQSAARGSKNAAAALKLANEPTRFLSTVQVGITLIGILSGAYAEIAISSRIQALIERVEPLAQYSEALALVIVVVAITYASLVFGELVPKRIALAFPEVVAALIARPLTLMSRIAALPVRVLSASTDLVSRLLGVKAHAGDDVSEEDVRSLVARAASTGVFTRLEHTLLQRTFSLGDLTVRELMVPRTDVVWIDEGMSIDSIRVLVGTSPHSHFPVCRGGLDHLIGVVHLKDLVSHGLLAGREFKFSQVARPPLFAPEFKSALRMLDDFKRARNHIAFVIDEYGSMLGLLTINDVVSALVGDISMRGEEPRPEATRRGDGSWLMDGRLPVREALPLLGIEVAAPIDMPDVSTVAGLVLAILGHVPQKGEYADWKGWRFEVVDMDGSRVDQVMVYKVPSEAETAAL